MSQEIPIVPQIEADCAVFLKRQAAQLDRILDSPHSEPKPIAQTGIMEEIGSLLAFFAALAGLCNLLHYGVKSVIQIKT